ncbi:MAG TPA: alpha/beta hydrolase [Candidatus Acidoferrales bacterium]
MNWPGVEMIRVPANGITFEVATMCAAAAEPGIKPSEDRLALCLHGFPEHAYSWRYQMPLLAKFGYRVWAPNLRGYGATDSPQEISAYTIDTLVADIAALIEASGAKQVLLLAHDWGGALAWILAMRRPELINRLVILNLPHPACFQRELKRARQLRKSWYMFFFQIPKLPEYLLRRNGAALIGRMFRGSTHHPERFPDDVIQVYRDNALRPGGLTAMLNWYRAFFQRRREEQETQPGAARPRLPKIEIPTLFLWGNADVALDFRCTEGTENYVTNLTFRVFPGVSHWIQQEAPEAVNAMLQAWLAGQPVPEYREL